MEEKRTLIEPEHLTISLARQCELVGLARSSYYYQPLPESEENLLLMRLLDEQYTRTPFYGIKKMTAWLRTQDYEVNHKRVARLLRQMGLMAIYPAPRLSQPGEQNVRYPYLLRGMSIDRVNQVWSTDITLHPPAKRVSVSGSHHRLVQSLCARLANVDHLGNSVLSRSARAGI